MTYFEAGEWPVSYLGIGCSVFADGGAAEEMQPEFERMAATLLWNWTHRVFGTRDEVIRPERVSTPWRPTTWEGMGPAASYYDIGSFAGGWGWLPAYSAGQWLSLRCGVCGSAACEHVSTKAMILPGPVQSVNKITVDGQVLPKTAYRLDYGHTLIRQDGGEWPATQDLLEPLTAVDTFSVAFTHGVEVPIGGQIAAGILACELAKAAVSDETCSLPSRVSSVTRQGVSLEIVQTEFSRANSEQQTWTGIFSIDAWISSSNLPRDYVGVASPDIGSRSTPKPRRGYSGTYGR